MKFNDLDFQIYLFKSSNFLLNSIRIHGNFEFGIGTNMIESLKYYKFKKNILNNKDILILDIGGNVGWYPSLLGRFNYTILSFEAFEKNYYVWKKNYCRLNKDSNVIIIPYGLGDKEKICHYYNEKNNSGNGIVKCEKNSVINNKIYKTRFFEIGKVEIIKLKYFIPYLSNKNLALIKMDVEGHELKILEGGLELITKFHIPFIILEYTPNALIELGSKPKRLIELFINNGYKISLKGFLCKIYITMEDLLKSGNKQKNVYFIHNSILK